MRSASDYEPTRSYQDDLDGEDFQTDPVFDEYGDEPTDETPAPLDQDYLADPDRTIDELEEEADIERLTPDEEAAEDRTP